MTDKSAGAAASATDDNIPNGDFEHIDSEERNLPVSLDIDDLATRGQLAAVLAVEIDALVEVRKAAASEAQAEIVTKRARLLELHTIVAAGIEDRPVVCNKEINWDANVVRFVRTDTGEVGDTEAQGSQDGDAAATGDDDDDDTDGDKLPPEVDDDNDAPANDDE